MGSALSKSRTKMSKPQPRAAESTTSTAVNTRSPSPQEPKPTVWEEVTVRVPDLFIDVMAVPHEPNPLFEQVRPAADAYTAEVLRLDAKEAEKTRKMELCRLSAMKVPRADEAGLRLMCDWNHWGFPWDDQFDEGEYQFDTMGGIREIADTLAILDNTAPPVSADDPKPLRYALHRLWTQIQAKATPYMQDHFRRNFRLYALGCLQQTIWSSGYHGKRSVEAYLDYRRLSIGVNPVTVVGETALGLDIPREAREHPVVLKCWDAMADITIIHNDILSMRKELEQGCEHNLVKWMLDLGMTPQEAMDKCSTMLDACFAQWHENKAKIPSFGPEVDPQMEVLLQLFMDIARGSLNWSFVTGRYLDGEGNDVRRTRMLKIKLPKA